MSSLSIIHSIISQSLQYTASSNRNVSVHHTAFICRNLLDLICCQTTSWCPQSIFKLVQIGGKSTTLEAPSSLTVLFTAPPPSAGQYDSFPDGPPLALLLQFPSWPLGYNCHNNSKEIKVAVITLHYDGANQRKIGFYLSNSKKIIIF